MTWGPEIIRKAAEQRPYEVRKPAEQPASPDLHALAKEAGLILVKPMTEAQLPHFSASGYRDFLRNFGIIKPDPIHPYTEATGKPATPDIIEAFELGRKQGSANNG